MAKQTKLDEQIANLRSYLDVAISAQRAATIQVEAVQAQLKAATDLREQQRVTKEQRNFKKEMKKMQSMF